MQDNKDDCLAFTALEEGGYSNDARDPGNWTMGVVGKGDLIGSIYGLSARVLRQYYSSITASQVKSLPVSAFDPVASTYWDRILGNNLPSGVDLMLFDFGYNAGVSRSIKLFQQVVGTTQDGIMGKGTISAISAYLNPDPKRNCWLRRITGAVATPKSSSDLVLAVADRQEAYYRSLSTFPTFGKGWLSRTSRRRNKALVMATKAGMSSSGSGKSVVS